MTFLECLESVATLLPGRTEADVQSDVKALLIAGHFLDEETPHLESPTGDGSGGRIDIEYGALVLECKKTLDPAKKGLLKAAEKQLAGYLNARQSQGAGVYAGMLTDGRHWRHYRLTNTGLLDLVSSFDVLPEPADDRSFRDWLGSALPTEIKVVPTGASIESRLGALSPTHQITSARLSELLATGVKNSEVALKRELWAKLLRTAFGTQFDGNDELFIEHTFLVVVATLIARAALGMPADEPAVRLLSGESFVEAGITGIGEAGFFDWMLSISGGDEVVLDIAKRVACFDWTKTDHDVLKTLYQSVISPEVRHRLGEYYTPDWLADRIVREVVAKPLEQRLLDPACGSGTFLFAAVSHYFEAAESAGKPIAHAVDELPGHVAGIDLHPVAVSLAQVTYMLAIGTERLAERTGGFAVPVYLGDSMRWDDSSTGAAQLFHTTDDVVVHTTDGVQLFASELRFPASVVGRSDFDSLVGELASKASGRKPKSAVPSVSGVLNKYVSSPEERSTLEKTFDLLCKLHDEGRDHIWGYFVRNQARPAWFTQKDHRVDILIGNPPWLAYQHMPEEMQKRFQERSKERNLWSGGKVAAHQDLSAFFVARATELYLKMDGEFAFVTPLAVLSRESYEGFRTGRWTATHGPQLFANLGTPWGLRGIRPSPFPVPSAVIFGRRANETDGSAMPTTIRAFSGKASGSGSWSSVADAVTLTDETVMAIGGDDLSASTYGERFLNGATLYPRMLALVVEGPPVPFLKSTQRSIQSRRSALEKKPWDEIPTIEGAVETQFVRPILLGESVIPFAVAGPVDGVIPYSKSTGLLSQDHPNFESFPGFAQWWTRTQDVWNENRGSKSKLTLLEQFDYMHKLEAQFPIAPIRVVYTSSGNTLAAAIVTDGLAVVENALYWAAVPTEPEGRYLCAILNAPAFTTAIRPYQSEGAFGPRHFHKLPWRLPVPVFDPTDELHNRLALVAEEAEVVISELELPADKGFQSHRGLARDALLEAGISASLDSLVRELLGID